MTIFCWEWTAALSSVSFSHFEVNKKCLKWKLRSVLDKAVYFSSLQLTLGFVLSYLQNKAKGQPWLGHLIGWLQRSLLGKGCCQDISLFCSISSRAFWFKDWEYIVYNTRWGSFHVYFVFQETVWSKSGYLEFRCNGHWNDWGRTPISEWKSIKSRFFIQE